MLIIFYHAVKFFSKVIYYLLLYFETVPKNNIYGIIKKINPFQNIDHNVVYADGTGLKYGDYAEIFGALADTEVYSFMQSAVSETYFSREHYWFTCGYKPADYENEEIKENEVRIHYAGVDNTITKKEFYELCLLLCNAKINGLDIREDEEVKREQLLLIKSQLEGLYCKNQCIG